jgi:hypothetical protein
LVNARARGEVVAGSLQGDRLSVGHFTLRVQQAGNGFQAISLFPGASMHSTVRWFASATLFALMGLNSAARQNSLKHRGCN